MLTRFFKLANCNFDPAQLLAEKRTAEMPQSDFEELVDFFGSTSAALENIENQSSYDLYRWSNWTPAPAEF